MRLFTRLVTRKTGKKPLNRRENQTKVLLKVTGSLYNETAYFNCSPRASEATSSHRPNSTVTTKVIKAFRKIKKIPSTCGQIPVLMVCETKIIIKIETGAK